MEKFAIGFHGGKMGLRSRGSLIGQKLQAEFGPGLYITSSAREAIVHSNAAYPNVPPVVDMLIIDTSHFDAMKDRLKTVRATDLVDFVCQHFPLETHKENLSFLASRYKEDVLTDPVTLINLAVNSGIQMLPPMAERLRKFQIKHGRQYDIITGSFEDHWREIMVIYDRSAIVGRIRLPHDFFDRVSSDPARETTPMFSDQVAGTAKWPDQVKEALLRMASAPTRQAPSAETSGAYPA